MRRWRWRAPRARRRAPSSTSICVMCR
jgi:hypothetical protein